MKQSKVLISKCSSWTVAIFSQNAHSFLAFVRVTINLILSILLQYDFSLLPDILQTFPFLSLKAHTALLLDVLFMECLHGLPDFIYIDFACCVIIWS